MWEDFTQRLRTQNIKTVKDFQKKCKWKWLVNNESKILCIKENDNMCKVHKKASENNRQNKYEHEKEDDEIDNQSEVVIRVLVNNKL